MEMNKTKQNKRLEYVDAMRGITMILVVYSHILMYYGYEHDFSQLYSYNSFIGLFRMPLFFFVSGFVLYKASQLWDFRNSLTFIAKKFKVQIISTIIFLFLYTMILDMSFIDSILIGGKEGYWFTITLFFFYILYILTKQITHFAKNETTENIIMIILALCIRVICSSDISKQIGIPDNIYNLFCVDKFNYYIYFIFGVITKKYFHIFKQLINKDYLISIIIVTFILTGIFFKKYILLIPNPIIALFMIITGITGIVTVFSFFYKYQDSFTKETKVGRVLQYIGKRTLDIYLLHYFFLPRNLQMVGEWFTENINPTLEFFVSLTLAAMVIALCLVVSNIIRISPFLANWLFGVKSK